MTMFSSLLVPLDGSPMAARSFECAAWLAQRLEARLHVLTATDGRGRHVMSWDGLAYRSGIGHSSRSTRRPIPRRRRSSRRPLDTMFGSS